MPASVLIFTLNEELHLPACLSSLHWCDDIIVIDSFSTDGTENVCRAAGVRFVQNKFEGFGTARNWALENAPIKHDWVLILDADERVPDELATEIVNVTAAPLRGIAAYRVRRKFYMWGHWLKHSSLYPTWVVRLIHRDLVRYINRGHAETQVADGSIAELTHDLIDENLKGIDEWFARQNSYSTREAEYELRQESGEKARFGFLSRDPLRRRAALKRLASNLPLRPVAFFFYSYLWRKGFLDGRDGLIFCLMKSVYQAMVVAKKHELRKSLREQLNAYSWP